MSRALPFVSVIIPMRNEEASIGACLEAVLAQDYPPDLLEVLVVDGDSDDGSAALIERYARDSGRVRLLHNPRRIVPPALNAAIRAARGALGRGPSRRGARRHSSGPRRQSMNPGPEDRPFSWTDP